jgi:predicted PurR-regulated permease PerM
MSPPTPNQSRIIWTALVAVALLAIAASVVAVVWAMGKVLHLFSPVLWPLAIAAVLAYLLDPVVDLLERRKMQRQPAIVFVFAVAALLVLGLAAAVVPRLVFETRDLARRIPDYAKQIQQRTVDWMENSGWQLPVFNPPKEAAPATTNAPGTTAEPNLAPGPAATQPDEPLETKLAAAAVSWLPKALPKVGNWLADQISRVAAWFGLLAGIALVPVYCFYFLLEKSGIQRRWTDYLPIHESRTKNELVFALTAINDRLIVFFRGQVLVAACDGVLYTIGFFAMGLNYALLLGVFAAFLSIIPYLGATITFVIALILSLVQFHDWLHPLLVLAIFGVVQALEGLVISPKIIGDRVGLHPLTIIIAVMIGTTLLGGILGGLLAIPLTAAIRELMFRYVWKKPESFHGVTPR